MGFSKQIRVLTKSGPITNLLIPTAPGKLQDLTLSSPRPS